MSARIPVDLSNIQIGPLLDRMRAFVAYCVASDPYSDDALVGEHMIAIAEGVVSQDPTLKDPMIQQMLGWAVSRNLHVDQQDDIGIGRADNQAESHLMLVNKLISDLSPRKT